VKENLKIRTPFESDKIEAQQLLFSIGNLWQGKFDELKIGATFFDCLFADGMSLTHGISEGGYFNGHAYKEITLPELRELARTKEYLNSEFELVVTNQPSEGWLLVAGCWFCKSGLGLIARPTTTHLRRKPDLPTNVLLSL